jgi:PAS domain S-box-containing protein
MQRLGARVERPRSPELEAALLVRHQSGDAKVGVLRAFATGQSQLLAPLSDATLRAIATSDADYELLRSLGLTATMYVPLRARGRTLGVLACSMRGNGRTLTAEDLRFAQVLGSRIGLALDNAGLSKTVSGLEKRLEATLAHLAAGVIVREADGRMAFANATAAELLGVGSVQELFAARSEQLMDLFDAYDEVGERLTLNELPSARALRGERPSPMVVRSVRRSTGRVRWLLHTATPVFEPDGSFSLAVNVVEDITESKRAELSQRLLSTAGRELSSSLNYERTLRRLAELAVPELADWCAVSVVGPGALLEQVAVVPVDPGKVALAREWGERYPTRLDDRSGAAEVIRSGRSQLVGEITDEMLSASDATVEQVALVREIGMRSLIIVRLTLPGGDPFGALSLVMAESGRTFDEEDLAVAEELGRRAAMAVQNARLYTERSRIARTLQHGLLPPALPGIPGFALASLYHPAGDATEVGGDFYDAVPTLHGWMVLIGDVTGHGAEAAALTSLSRYTLRTAARLLADPIAALEQLNISLLERPETSLVTVCCATLRASDGHARADVVLAGHPPPYHIHNGQPTAVGIPGDILGLNPCGNWTLTTIELYPDDLLVLLTDGVADTIGATERFGDRRLAEALRDCADAGDAVRRLDAALAAFATGPHRDDTAALAIHYQPHSAPTRPRDRATVKLSANTNALRRLAGDKSPTDSAAIPEHGQRTAARYRAG